MNFYQHSPEQINQLATALEDPDLDMKGLGWKAAFHLRELQALILDLEAQLYAIGSGGVGASIQPQAQPDTAQIPDVRIRTSAPDGWKLVPVEPTDDMFIEGMEADCRGRPSIDDDTHVRSIWRAMLSSTPDAPQPPAQQDPVGAQFRFNDGQTVSDWKPCDIEHHDRVQSDRKLFSKIESRLIYATPRPTENLNCKSNQKRLATLWGYVKQDLARQPLTNKEIDSLADAHRSELGGKPYFAWFDFARAIEEAHGITGGQQ